MGLVESTVAFLFRPRVPKQTEARQRQRTAAILMPICDQAADVAQCLVDNNEPKQANDAATKTPASDR